ncbi:MAG TPA: hypothetical protein VM598_07025 [Bdellovibrionota bacterium]|nr:hypothetical protein [Bdellovibrionota bacterium]
MTNEKNIIVLAWIVSATLGLSCMQRTTTESLLMKSTSAPIVKPDSAPVSPLETFRTTVYAITRAKCIACHNSPPLTPGTPEHAADDINLAYDWVKNRAGLSGNPIAKFLDIPGSELVIHAGNGHCGTFCAPGSGTQNEISVALADWIDVEMAFAGSQ